MPMLPPARPRRRGWGKTQSEVRGGIEPLYADAVIVHIFC